MSKTRSDFSPWPGPSRNTDLSFPRIAAILSCETADLRALAWAAGGDLRTFYVGACLEGVDIRGQDLRGICFEGADFDGVLLDASTLLDARYDPRAHRKRETFGPQMHPTGYLFANIEASTEKWNQTPDGMIIAQRRLDALIDEIVARYGGAVRDRAGDAAFATFQGGDPLQCALEIQCALAAENWDSVGGMSVRIGVHCGQDAAHTGENKANIHQSARITASAWGGQIVVSSPAAEAYPLPDGCEMDDFGVCRIKGVDEPIRLYGLVHPRLARTEFPLLRTLGSPAFSAPRPTRPIVGREDELTEIMGKLAGTVSWLTIVGAGGNGKTRLAIEIANRFSREMAVYFTSLEPGSSDADIVTVLARALKFPLLGGASQEEQLVTHLRGKRALIVLDNADELAGKSGLIGGVLSACAGVRILATSREQLQLEGENIFRLYGLSAAAHYDAAFRSAPACALFIQEARAIEPAFDLRDDQFATFREICDMVGGSPLALHLAAQWTHLLSVEEIHARLREGIDFLAELSGEAGRHRLDGVLDSSWALLDDAQRAALARLSAFEGGFDDEAAEAIADADISILGVLERKCILERRGRRRFVMHPMIHDDVRKRLAQTPGVLADETHRRHSEYFLDFVRRSFDQARGVEQGRVLDRVERELANVHAAWTWAVKATDVVRIRDAIEPLFYSFMNRALLRDCASLFSAPIGDERLRAYFLAIRASCLAHQGEHQVAEELARRALGDGECEAIVAAHCHHALGTIAHARGDYSIARENYEEALAERTRLADEMGRYYSAISLAFLELQVRNVIKARERLKESYRLCQSMGHLGGMLLVHACAGDIAASEGREAAAEERYRQAIEVEETVRNPQLKAITLLKLGTVCSNRGEFDKARVSFEEASELAAIVGDRRIAVDARLKLGRNLRLAGNLERAKAELRRALADAWLVASQPQLADALYELACVARVSGDYEAAARIANVVRSLKDERLRQESFDLINELLGSRAPAETDIDAALLDLINEPDFGIMRL